MQLYAQHPVVRSRQLTADLGMLAWTVLWVLVARTVHGAVLVLAEPGQAVQDLGASVAGNMTSAAEAASGVPVVGDELASPFEALADASGSVSDAGIAAQDAVGTLAFVLAVVLVVLPVGWLALRWLPWRVGYAREASAAARLTQGDAGPRAARRPGAGHRAAPPPRRPARRHRRRLAGRRPGGGAGAGRPRAAPARPAAPRTRTDRRDRGLTTRRRADAGGAWSNAPARPRTAR